ncbi:hypothetical protein TIFTF001_014662 [Ficus carica]|uniref:Uncharacterized protein n=1 Tax=Ficus carica TaxID=3494 RepID=A0AA88A6G3_FICCA|nr:hypothetical protein TIFTF001_014662 [Ficus carica]
MEVNGRIRSDVVVLNRFLYSAMEALVAEAAIAAFKSLTCSLFVMIQNEFSFFQMGSLCNTVDVFLKAPDAFGGLVA